MPFNEQGLFERLYSWLADRDNGVKIRADRMDQEMDGFKDAINAITGNTVAQRAPIRGVPGTAAAPGYTFEGDTNTGMYRAAADTIGFAVNGQSVMTLGASGISLGAADLAFTPDGAVTADNIQGAILQVDAAVTTLANAKFNTAGGAFTGLVSFADEQTFPIDLLDFVDVTGSTALVAGVSYRLRNTQSDALTLPANPDNGDTIRIVDSGVISVSVQPVIARNGNTIMGAAEDMTVNVPGIDFEIWFNGIEWRLR